MKDIKNSQVQIAAVVDEFLDWKEVYASKIPADEKGIVVFTSNIFGEAFIEYRIAKKTIKLHDKVAFDDGSEHGLTATVVWVDQ